MQAYYADSAGCSSILQTAEHYWSAGRPGRLRRAQPLLRPLLGLSVIEACSRAVCRRCSSMHVDAACLYERQACQPPGLSRAACLLRCWKRHSMAEPNGGVQCHRLLSCMPPVGMWNSMQDRAALCQVQASSHCARSRAAATASEMLAAHTVTALCRVHHQASWLHHRFPCSLSPAIQQVVLPCSAIRVAKALEQVQ